MSRLVGSSVDASVVRKLEEHGAMDHTIIAAGEADPAAMQFLAAFSGCMMGEYFRDRGDALIVTMTCQSKPSPTARFRCCCVVSGRGLSRGRILLALTLLERAARVNADYVEQLTDGKVKGQTGSLTALLIIETQLVTFLRSYRRMLFRSPMVRFSSKLTFQLSIRPAMNAGISVSRGAGRPRPRSSRSWAAVFVLHLPVSRIGGICSIRVGSR